MAKILIVEDERVVAWNIRETLKIFDYEIVGSVATGAEALQSVRTTPPDLVLMDIRLQGELDGISASESIQAEFDIPIVYLTAHADEPTFQRAVTTAPYGYILKPFSRVDLYTTIETALRRHQAERELQATRKWLETTLNSIADGTIATDPEGKIKFMNPAAEILTGWPEHEALGRPTEEVLKLINAENQTEIPNPLTIAIQQRQTQFRSGDCLLQARDGSTCPVGDSASPIMSDRGEVLGGVAVFQDMTERKLLEQTLRQQAEEYRLLASLTQSIRSSLDLQVILQTAVTEVRQMLKSDRVIIYRFNPDRSGDVISEAVSHPELALLGKTIEDPCFMSNWDEPYRRGRISAIEDIDNSDVTPCHVALLKQFQVRANLVLPLVNDDHLWGLLIAHQCFYPRHWQQWEVNLLSQIAGQLAIALKQAELHQQLFQLNINLEQDIQQRTAELQQSLDFEATLKRITDRVRDTLDATQILQAAVEELAQVLGASECNAAIYDIEAGIAKIQYEYNTTNVPQMQGMVIQMSHLPEIYKQLLAGMHFQFCHLPLDPQVEPRSINTMLACPIVDNQGVLGDLCLVKPSDDGFTPIDIRLVQQVANQCAIALRQAQLYQATQAQVEELDRLSRLKDEFLSTISHELRTPIANVKMAAEMLDLSLRQLGVLDQESEITKRYFTILSEECQKEISLINNLIDLSQLEARVEPLEPQPVDLHIWLPHIAEPFTHQAKQQNLQIEMALPGDLPLLRTDLSCLERIVTELLQNACKYTPAGNCITVTAQILTNPMETQSANLPFLMAAPHKFPLALQISNTGVDLPDEELDRIFDKFYRIPLNDPWQYGGTGLGLALVKKLVEYVGAAIEVKSHPNQIDFVLTFPPTQLVFPEHSVI
jgi:PAS domain S-box-containing protein